MEHIAPQTPTKGEPVAAGYCEYDDSFKNEYIDCLGNYLLLSKSHNCSVGNQPFSKKRESYTQLAQQREIQDMATEIWDKEKIKERKDKIVNFILENL
ncbi:MAG: HNH endonuclease family protein [Methylococcaceae bacterium]|nr:HNH endonuclease family protein [Methylococcaceae bacterium]